MGKKINYILFAIFMALGKIALAMNPKADLDRQYLGFKTLDSELIFKIATSSQLTSELSLAQRHCFHLIAWAYYKLNKITLPSLLVDDTYGFKSYAPPNKLNNFINNLLPSNSSFKAKIYGADELNTEIFLNIVTYSIENDSPILIYYLDKRIKLATIIGINIKNKKLLLLTPEEKNLIKIISASDLLKKMDLTNLILDLNNQIIPTCYPDFSVFKQFYTEIKKELKPFNLLTFKLDYDVEKKKHPQSFLYTVSELIHLYFLSAHN